MERIKFWRNELQGARLYDGRAKDSFSRICAALEANSSTAFKKICDKISLLQGEGCRRATG